MKISILTVCYNAGHTLGDTIRSVRAQHHTDVEYIVVDGASKDNTVQVIRDHEASITRWISEPDRGIYDAMNKAIGMATGEIVGILNADDFYAHENVLRNVASAFEDPAVDAVFGNLIVVDPANLKRVVRTYSAAGWHPGKFARGFMPPHPTFFVRRKFYEQYGLFKTDYRIASDYEMLIRLLYVHKLRYRYLPETMVIMRKGGVSSAGIKSNIILNNEILRGCRENGIRTNLPLIYLKYFRKVLELIHV
ncbi:MAG: glycosyltransferase [Cyclobacteriaceae bacterium]|nr:glycosyltransferase [Cyclobacteriaceae bacterium]